MGETKKIPASQFFEVDDAFIRQIKVKLAEDEPMDRSDKRLWSISDIARESGLNPASIRNHIYNYEKNMEGRKLKAEKRGKQWYSEKEDVEEYLKIKL